MLPYVSIRLSWFRALLTKRNESIRGGQRALPDRTIAGEKEREILATDRTLIAGRRLLQSYNSICIVRKCGYLALTSICRALISANLHVTGILGSYIFFFGDPLQKLPGYLRLPISILSRFRFPFVSYQIVFETRGPFLWESVCRKRLPIRRYREEKDREREREEKVDASARTFHRDCTGASGRARDQRRFACICCVCLFPRALDTRRMLGSSASANNAVFSPVTTRARERDRERCCSQACFSPPKHRRIPLRQRDDHAMDVWIFLSILLSLGEDSYRPQIRKNWLSLPKSRPRDLPSSRSSDTRLYLNYVNYDDARVPRTQVLRVSRVTRTFWRKLKAMGTLRVFPSFTLFTSQECLIFWGGRIFSIL